MDHENHEPIRPGEEGRATPASGPLVLSQMSHHAARPIYFPAAPTPTVWEPEDVAGDDALQAGEEDEDALAPPPVPSPTPVELPQAPGGLSALSPTGAPDTPAAEPALALTSPDPARRRSRSTTRRGLLGGGLLLLVCGLLLGGYVVLFPRIVPQATVILTPASATLSTSLTVTALPSGTPDPSRQQVAARLLAVRSPARSASGPTSGTGRKPARAAVGMLTFYNAAPYAQSIAAGTIVRGTDGIAVVTDAPAAIPAGNAPIEGQARVPAHVLQSGPQGNIAPLDVNGLCCAGGISVKNTSAFSGGQNTRTFPVVTAQDLSGLAAPLIASLTQIAQAEVRPSEQLVSLIQCRPTVTPDHPAESPAVRVMVFVTVTCRGETYDKGAVMQLAQAKLDQQAAALGAGYAPAGSISSDVTQEVTGTTIPRNAGTLVLLVSAQGTWAYQFSVADLHQDARLLAGKSLAQARALLVSREAGHLQQVVIHLSGWWSDGLTFPTNADAIHVLAVVP